MPRRARDSAGADATDAVTSPTVGGEGGSSAATLTLPSQVTPKQPRPSKNSTRGSVGGSQSPMSYVEGITSQYLAADACKGCVRDVNEKKLVALLEHKADLITQADLAECVHLCCNAFYSMVKGQAKLEKLAVIARRLIDRLTPETKQQLGTDGSPVRKFNPWILSHDNPALLRCVSEAGIPRPPPTGSELVDDLALRYISIDAAQTLAAFYDVTVSSPADTNALHHAANTAAAKSVALLIGPTLNVDVNLVRGGRTPLDEVLQGAGVTVNKKRAEIVQLLLDAGAEVNRKDSAGKLPHERIKRPPEVVEQLRLAADKQSRLAAARASGQAGGDDFTAISSPGR